MSVEPYREITFDKEGDGPAGQSAALAALARQGVTDLVLFAHGWNSSPSGATRLCSDFFEPFPGLLAPGVEAGYAGVIWPSMMFTGEPVPDYRALVTVLPEKEAVLDRLTELLVTEPPDETAFAEFGALLRELTDVSAGGDGRAGAAGSREPVPEFLVADPVAVCTLFTEALGADSRPGAGLRGGARTVLEGGQGGPAAGHVLRDEEAVRARRRVRPRAAARRGRPRRPRLRVHLVGHSMGARLVAYALKGLPSGPVRSPP